MLADVLRDLRVDIERIRRLVPVAGLAEGIGAGALGHLNARVIDLGQIRQVGRIPGVAGPELLQIRWLELAAGDAERVVNGVVGAADIEYRGGAQGVDRVARES